MDVADGIVPEVEARLELLLESGFCVPTVFDKAEDDDATEDWPRGALGETLELESVAAGGCTAALADCKV